MLESGTRVGESNEHVEQESQRGNERQPEKKQEVVCVLMLFCVSDAPQMQEMKENGKQTGAGVDVFQQRNEKDRKQRESVIQARVCVWPAPESDTVDGLPT